MQGACERTECDEGGEIVMPEISDENDVYAGRRGDTANHVSEICGKRQRRPAQPRDHGCAGAAKSQELHGEVAFDNCDALCTETAQQNAVPLRVAMVGSEEENSHWRHLPRRGGRSREEHCKGNEKQLTGSQPETSS